ncbi:MAG: MBL fold metallo-hydrolase [bacterium]
MGTRQVGELKIDRIVESENADIDPTSFFPGTTPADWERHRGWLQPTAMDPKTGNLILPIQSYLLRTRHHTILVDGCVGNDKPRERHHWNLAGGEAFLKGLSAAGVAPEQVDFVLCTHLHADHVGWNTRLREGRWVPTFANARYVISRHEFEFWNGRHATRPLAHFGDSVLPVLEAGQADLVENDFTIDDAVWLEPTPGHTPHHLSIRVSSLGRHGVFLGDVMHSPAQCAEPHWGARTDWDPAQGRKTRRAFLEKYCESDVLVFSAHFASPSVGRIARDGEAFRFQYDGLPR